MCGGDETAALADDEQLRLSALISTLRWANSTRDRLALPIWVEQIWLRLGGPITALPDDLPRVRLFFDALRRAEASGIGLNTERIVEDLNSISLDSAAPSGSVRVLTLHKAKGLEFDYVFLPALQKLPRANTRELLRWHWHDGTFSAGLLIAADDQEKSAPTLYNYLNWLQKAKQHEELKRLLYVGITRARERAFLSGTVKTEEGKGERPAPAGSLLSLLQQITATPITHEPAPAAGASKSEVGAMGLESEHNPGLHRIASAALAVPAVTSVVGDSEDLVRSRGISEHGDQENRAERSVGTITHRILERLTTIPSPLPSAMTDEILGWISTNTLRANLTPAETEHVQSACATLVANTLGCEIGRWLLSGHRDAHSELQVARVEAGEVRQYFIDRTFYDEREGVRWIIDDKTSSPKPNESEDSFKSRELTAYGGKLATYADLLKNYGWQQQVPIKTALYFPAIQALAVHS
jgi:ATP-dependent exoDNAse (exonuclease V) beta subunit